MEWGGGVNLNSAFGIRPKKKNAHSAESVRRMTRSGSILVKEHFTGLTDSAGDVTVNTELAA